MLKKITLIFLLSLYLFLTSLSSFPASALAASPPPSSTSTWYKQDFTDWYSKVYDTSNASEIYGERYTAAQVEWVIYGLFAFILNHVSDQSTSVACIKGDVAACEEAIKQSIQKLQDLINQAGQSSTKATDQNLASLVFSQRSFSGIGYVREKIENLKLIPEAKAQTPGFGFGALDPIKGLWAASRNIAYGLTVLAVLILAFMIMFRVKISPQVVISAQSAIPKVIVALIFVTFSYAIAGFLIDLMYVVIGLISLGLGQYLGQGAVVSVFRIMTDGFIYLGFLGNVVIYSILFFLVLCFVLFVGSGILATNLLLTVTGILPLIFIIVIIIVAIMLIFMFFKILWLLLKTLAQIYLLVIVGPIQIIMGSVLQGLSVGSWIRSLAANLAVYPVVGFLFMLSFVFLYFSVALGLGNLLGNSLLNTLSRLLFGTDLPFPNASWNPPLTLGESYIPLIFVGISFFVLTLIPKVAEIIQGFISGKPFAYGTAIGEAVGLPTTLARGGLAAGIGRWEEGRKTSMGTSYEPHAVTKFLSTTGIIKTH